MSASYPTKVALRPLADIMAEITRPVDAIVREQAAKADDRARRYAREMGIYQTGFLVESHFVNTSAGSTAGDAAFEAGERAARTFDGSAAKQTKPGEFELCNGAPYAGPVHDGTTRMGARPWLLQAALDQSQELLADLDRGFNG